MYLLFYNNPQTFLERGMAPPPNAPFMTNKAAEGGLVPHMAPLAMVLADPSEGVGGWGRGAPPQARPTPLDGRPWGVTPCDPVSQHARCRLGGCRSQGLMTIALTEGLPRTASRLGRRQRSNSSRRVSPLPLSCRLPVSLRALAIRIAARCLGKG